MELVNNTEKGNLNNKDYIEEIDRLNKLSQELENTNPQGSYDLARDAYKLAVDIDYKRGKAISLLRMGRYSWILGDLEKALSYLLESLELFNSLEPEEYQVEVINALGNVNVHMKIYDRALDYYLCALKLARDNKYLRREAGALNNIGEIYRELKDYETALKYYYSSTSIYEKLEDDIGKSIPLVNIGSIYIYLHKYDMAKEYIDLSLRVAQEKGNRVSESYCLHQLGILYHHMGDRDKAIEVLESSLLIYKSTGNRLGEIETLVDLFDAVGKNQRDIKAIDYLYEALEIAREIKATPFIAKIYSYLASRYEEEGDYQKAVQYFKLFYDIEQSSNRHDLEQKLRSVTAQFEFERSQKEKEIYQTYNLELKEKTLELENKTSELLNSYNKVKIISEIGQSITSTLDLEKVLSRVYQSINSLMDASVFGIGIYNEADKEIQYKLYIEESKKVPPYSISITSQTSWAVWCITNNKEVLVNDVEKEYSLYLKSRKNTVGGTMESLIYYPLAVEDKIVGVVTVQSKKKNAYTQYDLDTIKALASYIAIAINNAQKSARLAEEIEVRKETQNNLEELNKKLLRLSEIDGMTGIPNRRRFNEYYHLEWDRAKRDSTPLTLMLIDIDQFKQFNDHYGHLEGDKVICQVAESLKAALKRTTDFIARFGGDEFAAVLPNTEPEGARQVAEDMIESIRRLEIEHNYSGIEKYITITIGCATIIPSRKMTKETLISEADQALYRAKDYGRNRVEFYQEGDYN